jgi:glycosyltransferase involved in cell wall biosynthesis
MSKRIKILITIDWFLPGTLSGGPVRSYANIIDHLKDDFEFYIITRNTDYGADAPYENITPNTWITFNDYTKIYYSSASELKRGHFKNVVNAIDFDVAYINGIYSWWFSILPIFLLKKTEKPIIIAARGMLNPQAFSVKGAKKKIFLKLARWFNVYRGVWFHATNADEAECIKNEIGPSAQVSIAPNLPRKATDKLRTKTLKQNPVKFVNIARIAVEKGTLKMLEGLHEVKEPLQLDLYGPIYDAAYWNKCLNSISKLPDHIKVNYKGILDSDQVPLTLSNYDFFVLLSEGENFGHAILEALSAGLPVIISNQTPWKDLEAKCIGWDIDTSDKINISLTIRNAINSSDAKYMEWSQAAFHYAKLFIENPEWVKQNKALFLTALKT